MEYTKLNSTLRERIVFLFTGLLPSKYISENKTTTISSQPKQEENVVINNIEENNIKMDIPFFDLDNSETKSNL